MKRRTKKRLFVLLLIPALAVVMALGYWGVQARRASLRERARAEGMAAYAEQNYPRAAERLGYYVGRQRGDGEALLAFADSVRRTPRPNNGHLVRAVAPNRFAAEALPGDPRPLRNLLDLYTQLGFGQETVGVADQLLALEPNDEEALQAKAFAQYRLGRLNAARETAEDMLQISPVAPWALGVIVETRLQAGDPPADIERWLGTLAEAHPGDVDILLLTARVQSAAGEIELARETLRVASRQSFDSVDEARRLIGALDANGLGLDGDAMLARIGDEGFVSLSVERLWKQGRLAEARRRATDALAAQDEPRVNLAGLGAMVGAEGAAERLEMMVESADPDIATAAQDWQALAECRAEIEDGDIKDVVDRLRALQSRMSTDSGMDPRAAAASYLLGAAHVRQGNLADAIAAWRTLLNSDPSWTLARAGIATALLDAGRADEAYRDAFIMLQRSPGNPVAARVYLLATSQLLERGATLPESQSVRLDEAVLQLREAVKNDGDLLCVVAQVQLARGDVGGATDTLQAIEASSGPASAGALARLAIMAQQIDAGYARAVGELAGRQGALGDQFAVAEAIAAGRRGDLDEGLRILDEAIASATAENRINLERARAQYLRSIDQRRALEALRALADREPGNVLVQTDLLNHPLAWEDCAVAGEALRRLGALVGQESSLWKTFEARRLLACDGSAGAAANALLLLTPVLQADPMAVEPRLLAADADLALQDRASAITRLSEYVNRDGRDVRVHLRLVPLLRQAGRPDDAQNLLLRTAQIEPIPTPQRVQRAMLLETGDRIAEARADYIAAAETGDRNALVALLAHAARARDFERGDAALDKLRAMPGRDLASAEVIAAYLAAKDDLAGAVEALRNAPNIDEDDRAIATARLLRREGEDDEAARTLLERADRGGGVGVWTEVVSIRLENNEIEEASRILERAQQRYPDDARLQALRGAVNLVGGTQGAAAAMAAINAAIALQNAPPEMRELGLVLERHVGGRTTVEQYMESLRSITTRHPTFQLGWRTLITAAIEAGRPIEAVNAAQAMITAMPTEISALRMATETLAGVRRFDEALLVAQTWRERAGSHSYEADLTVAELYGIVGRPEDALAAIIPHRERIEANDTAEPAHFMLLVRLLAGAGRASEARALMDPRVASDVAWAEQYVYAVESLRTKPQTCRDWLRHAEGWTTTTPRLTILLGNGWRVLAQSTGDASDYREAARLLGAGAAQSPSAEIFVALAEAQAGHGDQGAAEASLRRALRINEDPIALNNLAALLAEVRPSDPEARALATRALEIARAAKVPAGALASFLDTLGYAELRAGRPQEALRAFREALSVQPGLAEAMVGSAEAHLLLGDHEAARSALVRVGPPSGLQPALAARLQAVVRQLEQSNAGD